MSINQRLKDIGIQLRDAVAAVANCVPMHLSPDETLNVSRQIAFADGVLADRGTLDGTSSVEDALRSNRPPLPRGPND